MVMDILTFILFSATCGYIAYSRIRELVLEIVFLYQTKYMKAEPVRKQFIPRKPSPEEVMAARKRIAMRGV